LYVPENLRSKATGTLVALVDQAALKLGRLRNAQTALRDFDELGEAKAHYEHAFAFQEGAPLYFRTSRGEAQRGLYTTDRSWDSAFDPVSPARDRARYLAKVKNRTCTARWIQQAPGKTARTACIFLHGFLGGFLPWESRKFPCRAFAEAGIDVVLPLLPFHGLRAEAGEHGAPFFPSQDPYVTMEGFRQAIFELDALVQTLKAAGAERIGIVGISLGAYIASLYCTLHTIHTLGAITPLVHFSDAARSYGGLGAGPEADRRVLAVEAVMQHVSPLARQSLVKSEHVFVSGARHDHITPIAHAEALAKHFGTHVREIPGAHILAIGRSDMFREILLSLNSP
jgi:dienelactone hydrolase